MMTNKLGKDVEVYFEDGDTRTTYREIQELINTDPEAKVYTIYEVGEVKSAGYAENTENLPQISALE